MIARSRGRRPGARCRRSAASAPALFALLLPPPAGAQDLRTDTTPAYSTFGTTTEITDNRALMENGFRIGRIYRFGGRVHWSLRPELALGLVNTFEGYRGYGALALWAGRSWEQSLIRVSERYRTGPSVLLGAGVYRFDGGHAIPGRPWVPMLGVGLGVDVHGPPAPGRLHGTVTTAHIVREERLADGLDSPRWLLRVGFGVGTSRGRLLPAGPPEEEGERAWWLQSAPEIPAGPDRAGTLPRADLPHHVYGYGAEERLPAHPERPTGREPELGVPDSVALDPGHRGPLIGTGNLSSPLERARRRLEIDPTDVYAMHELGAAFGARGRHAEALRALSHALASTESSALRAVILTDIGTAWAELGWADSALVVWTAAAAESRHTPAAAVNAGVLLEELGRGEPALDWYRRAADRAPDVPVAWENLAYALVRLGREGEAVEPLTRALALRQGARGMALLRWSCHDRALYRELTGEDWRGEAGCARVGVVPTPGLLPRH